jgi:Flp pilus assembly pilin Flp
VSAVRGDGPAGRHARGQGVVEFGLILALGALVAVVILLVFRPQLAFVLSLIGSEVERQSWLLGGAGLA